MSGKKKLIVLAALVVVSCASSFLVSRWMGGTVQPPSQDVSERGASSSRQEAFLTGLATAGAEKTESKHQQLDELVKELRLKIAELRQKEEKLRQREKWVQIAEDQLEKQANELESLRIQLVVPLTRLKEAQAKLQRSRIVIKKIEVANLRNNASILDGMDPAEGSKILEGMCTNKQMEDAVRILRYMSKKKAAKLLAEMSDKALAAGLFERMKRLQEEG